VQFPVFRLCSMGDSLVCVDLFRDAAEFPDKFQEFVRREKIPACLIFNVDETGEKGNIACEI
ncbi:hypothetical protein, partial [Klebsiella pneumoniae]|uniref:hypothetical protein n=1 Tax=Klebsiella pneumoniae TaxID=573 RepID=UPI0040557250